MSRCPNVDRIARGGPEIDAHLELCSACRAIAALRRPREDGAAPPDPEPPAGPDPGLFPAAPERYRVEAEIGRGGMGRVLSARDLRIGRAVALKEALPAHPGARERFEREARITARLQHPGIVSVYEVGRWPDGRAFYAMPILSGRSLLQAMAAARTVRERLHLLPALIAAADAVAYAHSRRIIHRDLTPSNILLGDFGETTVIDWGVARELDENAPAEELGDASAPLAAGGLTVRGTVMGTPAYIAPEQAAGEPVDERADVYALGAILYQLLAGHPPYADLSPQVVLETLRSRRPPAGIGGRPRPPSELISLASRAMQPDREQRLATAAAFVEDLRRHQLGQRLRAHRYSPGELVTRWLARRLALVAAGVAALLVVAAVALLASVRVAGERNRAESTTRQLLVEQGRQEALAGNPSRALPYLEEAHRRGERSRALAFLLRSVRRSTDRPMRAFAAPASPGESILSPDGRYLAIAHAAGITIYDALAGRVLQQLADGRRRLDRLMFSRDGSWLVSFSPPGTPTAGVTVWDVRGWATRVLASGRDVTSVDLSPDGRLMVVTGADERGAEVWEIGSGRKLRSFPAQMPGDRLSARFSPDGRSLLTFGRREAPTIRDLATGSVRTALAGRQEFLACAAISPDGRRLATGGPSGARLWALPAGLPVADLIEGQQVSSVSFDPTGVRLLAISGEDAQLFEAEDGARVVDFPGAGYEGAALFSPDGQRIATNRDGFLRTYLARTGGLLESYDDLEWGTQPLFTPDGHWLVSAYNEGTVRFLDLNGSVLAGAVASAPETEPHAARRPSGLRGLAAQAVLTTNNDGALEVWDQAGRRLPTSDRFIGTELLALSADRTRALVTARDDPGRLRLQNVITGELLHRLDWQRRGDLGPAALSADGALLLTSDRSGTVLVWDGGTATRLAGLPGFTDAPAVAIFSPDGSRLYLAEAGTGRAGLWDPRRGRKIASLTVGRASSALFSPDSRLLAVTGDYTRLWRASDGAFAYSLGLEQRPQLGFSRDSAYLTVLGFGLAVVDVASGRPLVQIDERKLSAALFAGSSDLLVTVGRDTTSIMEWRTRRVLARLAGDGAGDAVGQAEHAERHGWTEPLPPVAEVSADGALLAVSHQRGGISLWRLDTGDAAVPGSSSARPRPWQLIGGQLVHTTAASSAPRSAAPTPSNREPQNLDFEQGVSGQAPSGWLVSGKGYRASLSGDRPRRGRFSALLQADPGTADGGSLFQSLDALVYRRKLVRARAFVRCRPGSSVTLAVWVRRLGGLNTPPASVDGRELCTEQWQSAELIRYVDQDADRLTVGVRLQGAGQVWLDDVTFETVSQ